jgi:hypothetical protein
VGTFSADVKNQRPVLLSIKSDWKHNHRHEINTPLFLWLVHKRDYFLVMHRWCCVGNCNIHAEQKILVMNEMKQYEIQSKPKVLVKENFHNLPPNFVKGLNKSKAWVHLCSKAPFSTNQDILN